MTLRPVSPLGDERYEVKDEAKQRALRTLGDPGRRGSA